MTLELVEECNSLEELNEREIYWIAEHNSFIGESGYNMTRGGDGVDSETASELKKQYWDSDRSIEHRERNSQKFKENNPSKKGSVPHNKGKKVEEYLSEDAIRRMQESRVNRWTDEARAARSKKTKELWEAGAFANRPPHTEEANARRSAALKGRKQTDYQKHRASEARQKTYLIHWMDGTIEKIVNLTKFVKERRIPSATVNHVLYSKKSSPKWGIEKIVPYASED